jgi:dolichol-phosphate mannosyltransferase
MTSDSSSLQSNTLVIIPTYNERDNIRDVIRRVLGQPVPLDILIVDDNSPDGTGELVAELSQQNKRIHLLRRSGKLGLGTAYITGFRYALEHNFDFIFEMDADLSHDPDEIPKFLKAAQEAHLVIGSRYINGVNVVNWPLSRLLLSYFASVYARTITGLPVRDTTSGYKCFRRQTLEGIDLGSVRAGGYAFQIEMKWRVWMAGFKLKEIPITFVDRTVGKSKMSKSIVREAMMLVWKLGLSGLRKRGKLRSSGGWQPIS